MYDYLHCALTKCSNTAVYIWYIYTRIYQQRIISTHIYIYITQWFSTTYWLSLTVWFFPKKIWVLHLGSSTSKSKWFSPFLGGLVTILGCYLTIQEKVGDHILGSWGTILGMVGNHCVDWGNHHGNAEWPFLEWWVNAMGMLIDITLEKPLENPYLFQFGANIFYSHMG